MLEKMKDSEILIEIKNGNQQVLYGLYEAYRNDFIHFAQQHYSYNKENAKDIFQETILALYENICSGKLTFLTCDIKTYLFSIGKYKLINDLKKTGRMVTYDEVEMINDQTNPFKIMDDNDYNKKIIKENLEQLTKKEREILKLYYEENRDMESIAKKLGYKNADVAKKQKYLALKKLAALVKKNLKLFSLIF